MGLGNMRNVLWIIPINFIFYPHEPTLALNIFVKGVLQGTGVTKVTEKDVFATFTLVLEFNTV